MRDENRWSMVIARIGGVTIRLHMFYWLFALFAIYFAWLAERKVGELGNLVGMAGVTLGMLAASVLLHEIARLFVIRRFGGRMDSIVIGPFGGMSSFDAPPRPRDEMLAYMAGPGVNLALSALAVIVLLVAGEFKIDLLHPLRPIGATEGATWVVGVKLLFWINWVLLLLNLLPAFPLNGGRALRAAILWRVPHLGRREASRWVTRLARLTSCLLIMAAVFCWRDEAGFVATWFALALLAIFLFFSPDNEVDVPAPESLPRVELHEAPAKAPARQLFADEPHPLAAENVSAFATFEPLPPVDDEQRMDEILARVYEQGVDSLSADDRAFLEMVSARYRQRLKHGV